MGILLRFSRGYSALRRLKGATIHMSDRKDIDETAFREKLLERRRELQDLTESSGEERQTVELDQQRVGRLSRMDALQGQAMAKEVDRRREVELQRITAALERLDEGEFGYCVACGEDIPLKRLELDPTAPTCINCAKSIG